MIIPGEGIHDWTEKICLDSHVDIVICNEPNVEHMCADRFPHGPVHECICGFYWDRDQMRPEAWKLMKNGVVWDYTTDFLDVLNWQYKIFRYKRYWNCTIEVITMDEYQSFQDGWM